MSAGVNRSINPGSPCVAHEIVRLHIVHYNRLLADALCEYMAHKIANVVVTQSRDIWQAAVEESSDNGFDLIILHMSAALDWRRELAAGHERFPGVPIVMYSGLANRRQIKAALDSGAAGFITADLSGPAVIKALELVLAGATFVPSVLMSAPSDGLIDAPWRGEPRDLPSQLTEREREVLALLVRGYANKRIASDLGVKEVTVAFHLRGIFRKLGVSNRTEAVAEVLRVSDRHAGSIA